MDVVDADRVVDDVDALALRSASTASRKSTERYRMVSSAPQARAIAAFSSLPTVAIMRAPRALASWISNWPTPPAPACGPVKARGRAPSLIWVRCMMRRLAESNGSRRCMGLRCASRSSSPRASPTLDRPGRSVSTRARRCCGCAGPLHRQGRAGRPARPCRQHLEPRVSQRPRIGLKAQAGPSRRSRARPCAGRFSIERLVEGSVTRYSRAFAPSVRRPAVILDNGRDRDGPRIA